MLDIPFVTKDGTQVRAHQIGRFAVYVCCGLDRHVVTHIPSRMQIICGRTHEQAVCIADTLSIYTPGDLSTTDGLRFWNLTRPDLYPWAWRYVATGQTYVDFYIEKHKVRPRPATTAEPEIDLKHLPYI